MIEFKAPRNLSVPHRRAELKPVTDTLCRCITYMLFTLAIFTSYSSLGFNLGFLDDAPIAEFNEKDIEIMLDTLDKALNNGADGVEVKWDNPETGNNGIITPLNSTTQDGKACRRTLLKTFSRTFSGSSQYRLCKDDDDQWKVVTSPSR